MRSCTVIVRLVNPRLQHARMLSLSNLPKTKRAEEHESNRMMSEGGISSGGFKEKKEEIRDQAKTKMESVKNEAKSMINEVPKKASEAVQGIKDAGNSIKKGLNDLGDKLGNKQH